jgi:hypothetical protein
VRCSSYEVFNNDVSLGKYERILEMTFSKDSQSLWYIAGENCGFDDKCDEYFVLNNKTKTSFADTCTNWSTCAHELGDIIAAATKTTMSKFSIVSKDNKYYIINNKKQMSMAFNNPIMD